MTNLQRYIVSDLMERYNITLKDIQIKHSGGRVRNQAERNVCRFHDDLRRKSVLFHVDWQSETFKVPASTIWSRIKFCNTYLN